MKCICYSLFLLFFFSCVPTHRGVFHRRNHAVFCHVSCSNLWQKYRNALFLLELQLYRYGRNVSPNVSANKTVFVLSFVLRTSSRVLFSGLAQRPFKRILRRKKKTKKNDDKNRPATCVRPPEVGNVLLKLFVRKKEKGMLFLFSVDGL